MEGHTVCRMPKPIPAQLHLDEQLFHPGQRVGVAVSGGADSVALLRALLERRGTLGLVLSVLHVHHGIRGEEAQRDQAFVEALAAEHDLPTYIERSDTPARAAQYGETLEEAARHLRYSFFRELLASGQLDAVATAHTLDDQAETVLHKLLRGAWTEGLGGISPLVIEPQGRIIRPLLGASRRRVEAYLRSLDQPWCEDSTNRDTVHTRNRIRHELLPALGGYNPQIADQLAHLAAIARDEEAYWQREIARIAPALVLPGKPVRGGGRAASTHPQEAAIAFELERLRLLSTAVQRRLLRWAANQLGCPLDFDHTERLMELCGFSAGGKTTPRQLDLSGEVVAQRTAREIQFLRKAEVAAPRLDLALPIPGELRVPQLALLFIAQPKPGEASNEPACIRYPHPGDRVTPRHSRGPKTIKEVLERQKLPASERQRTPLVVWKGEIIWLKGVELDPSALARLPFSLEVRPIPPDAR
jgi:tRNA(Ile)-lysidine synthase